MTFDLDALVADGHVFGKNRNAALALLVVGVQDALFDLLVFAEHARSLQEAVDKGRLAMVDMGDDGDIANVFLKHACVFLVTSMCPPHESKLTTP